MLERIGISLEEDLLAQFDRLIADKGYVNRSEAILTSWSARAPSGLRA